MCVCVFVCLCVCVCGWEGVGVPLSVGVGVGVDVDIRLFANKTFWKLISFGVFLCCCSLQKNMFEIPCIW